MPESLKTRLFRYGFNVFPAYFGTGAHVSYISADWYELHVELPLNRRSRNYVGTLFGGSLYGCVDPVYMIMLIKILGPNYVVWDKAANIQFKKPGRSTLRARFLLTDVEIAEIRHRVESEPSVDRIYTVDLVDAQGVLHARIEKTLYIRKRREGERPYAALRPRPS